MARHRRRPVPRHQARRSGGNSAAARPPERRLVIAMRRVVVTPTFAAGLGVVVAAVLALQMRTAFNYAAPNDAPCRTNSCGVPYHAGGEPASGAGDRISTSVPSATRSGAGSSPPAKRQPAGGNHGRPPSAGPGLGYSTVHKGQWGFDGTIVI